MSNPIFTGAGVAIVTPFHEDGSVNYPALEKLLEFHIENGTDSIVICGTTGESATLTPKEHADVIKFTVDTVNHRIPVIAGTGCNNTKQALENSLSAEKLGVDGLLIVTPYYNKTSQSGLIKHYEYIADRVKTPIILYNVPSRTGVSIKPQTYLKLSKHENIVAVKEASGDISSLAETISLCKDNLAVYSGNDDQTVPILSLGGIGVISVFSNICPKECHEMVQSYFDGDTEKSKEIQLKYLKLMNAMFCDVNPIPVKEALNLMGFNTGRCRMPLDILSESNYEKLKEILKEYSLIK